MTFPENLVSLRNQNNMTQEQLADKLCVTRQSVSKWESGQSMPDVEKLIQLAELFRVTTDELLNGLKTKKDKVAPQTDIYVILTFIFLMIVWFSGLAMVICMSCFFKDFIGGIVDMGLDLMSYATWGFGAMLGLHLISKYITYRKS